MRSEPLRSSRRNRFIFAPLGLLALLAVSGCGDDQPTDPGDASAPIDTFPPRDTITIEIDGLPPMAIPSNNPITVQGVRLGRRLFYDPILSGDSTLSCGGCHAPRFAFSDSSNRFSEGIAGLLAERNTPPIINAGWSAQLFWDGRALSLEDQAREPVADPIEMNLPWNEAISRLRTHRDYPALFGQAYGTTEITETKVVRAIAQFERTLISLDSKYDRFLRDEEPFTDSERQGLALFFSEKGGCFHCHGVNDLLTDDLFHDIALDSMPPDAGRSAVTSLESDRGKFKTPTLRNIELTRPYMHDGRFDSLEEVLDHYRSGGFPSPNADALFPVGRGFDLTDQETADLIAFLKTLTDLGFVQNPDYGPPVKE